MKILTHPIFRLIFILSLLLTNSATVYAGKSETKNVRAGDTFTVYTSYHNYTQSILWTYDPSVLEPLNRIYDTTNEVTFKALQSVKTVVQATTYYYKSNTTSSGINKDVDSWTINITGGATAQTTVRVNPTSHTMNVGEFVHIYAYPDPDSYSGKYTWSVSGSNVCHYTPLGNWVSVSAVGPGSCTVRVKLDNGSYADSYIQVNGNSNIKVTKVWILPQSLDLSVGETKQLSADITPDNATDKSVTWESDNSSVATISSTGLVKAISKGSAKITCTANDGSGKYDYIYVHVNENTIPVTSIALDYTSKALSVGSTLQLTATVSPSNATDKSVSWKSSNTNIATVSSTGLVTAKAEGSATITCTANDGSGCSAKCTITVSKQDPTSVSLTSPINMKVGETYTLTPQVSPSNASSTYTWETSNDNVVAISSTTGSSIKLTAKHSGEAIIKVTSANGKTATSTVNVISDVIESVTTPTDIKLKVGQSSYITATIIPSNVSTYTLEWETSNSSVATVLNTGSNTAKITAKKVGTAIIKVTTNNNITASTLVRVIENTPEVESLTLQSSLSIYKNYTGKISLSVKPSGANENLIWITSNPNIAVVSPDGTVHGVGVGKCTITVRSTNGKSSSCTVTVTETNDGTRLEDILPRYGIIMNMVKKYN